MVAHRRGADPGSGSPTIDAPFPGGPAARRVDGTTPTTEEHEMRTRTLGRTGPAVSALGLGAMGMSGAYGAVDRAEAVATVHAALDAGVTLIDTGDFYGMGHNELLLAEALRGRDRDSYQLSVKFGQLRGPGTAFGGPDNRPEAVRNFLAYSLTRLGVDHVDIYRPARLDPAVPIEDTAGAIAELIDAGYVRHLGLSEVDAATVRRAHAVHPVADLQIEYSLLSRAVEDDILPTLRELGIGLTAYGVLGRGLLSGHWSAGHAAGPGDVRGASPRFTSGNVEHNLALVAALRRVAEAKDCTVAQLALAWVAARGEDIVPLVGARTRERLAEALPALDVALTADDLAEIERAVPRGSARGDRYPAAFMASLGTGN
jgi:aryl-alcohol dehydrogenase-like predicted oxidoreductase